MARSFLTIYVLALGFSVALAGAEAGQDKQRGGSPPPVTLRTLITGTCQEIQHYAESVVGTGAIRSAAEVQRGSATDSPHQISVLFSSLHFMSLIVNVL